jgi:hypothetical protein
MELAQGGYLVNENTTNQMFDETNAELLAIELYSPLSTIICNSANTVQQSLHQEHQQTHQIQSISPDCNVNSLSSSNGQEFNLLSFENSFLVQNNLNTCDETNDTNPDSWKRYGSVDNLIDLSSNSYYTTSKYVEPFQDQTSVMNIDSTSIDDCIQLKTYNQTCWFLILLT